MGNINKELIINCNDTILHSLKRMDIVNRKLLLVFCDNKFYSLLSIGDVQRAILNNISLDSKIKVILRDEVSVCKVSDSYDFVKEKMFKLRVEYMPILDEKGDLVKILFWDEVFGGGIKRHKKNLKLPVVIMAGGKGVRLKPLTNVIPKPLLPIGDKTIVEEIMDRFVDVGCTDFFLSVNYKAEIIKHYFSQLIHKTYNIYFFQEDRPLGTAGSLFLVKDKIKTTFFVSNCDIIVDEDYSEILKYHKNNKNELTIVSALKHYPIPYGTINTKKEGILSELKEKPELTFQINTGFYILEPHLLDEVPSDVFFHITDLVDQINNRNGKIGVFPISEGSWLDLGDRKQYFDLIMTY